MVQPATLGINVILNRRVLLCEMESQKGGDERRLFQRRKQIGKGRTFVFRLGTDTRKSRPLYTFYYPDPPITNHAVKGKETL